MMCKFLKLASQDPRLGVLYVSGAIDANGVARDEVTLIRGDPVDFERVVNSLAFTERYKSFVASWSPGDAPTADQMERYVIDLERLCFGDLEPDRFCMLMYVHRKGDKVDLHALIANVELSSGKHFNAAPPGWQHAFDAKRDMHNAREGWASPADPRLARRVQPAAKPQFKDARSRQGLATPNSAKAELSAVAISLVDSGKIGNRAALVEALNQKGQVKNVSAKFIAIVPTGLEKAVRLRGAIFEEGFDFVAAAQRGPRPSPAPRPSRTSKDHDADRDLVAAEEARLRFELAIARRHAENIRRYAPRKKQTLAGQRGMTGTRDQDALQEELVATRPFDLSVHETAKDSSTPTTQALEPGISTTGLIEPQLLRALPIINTTKEENHEEFYRPAFSRVVGKLVLGLRERFEQLAQQVVEFGANIRRKRWLHAARFDSDRRAVEPSGAQVPGEDAGPRKPATPVITQGARRRGP